MISGAPCIVYTQVSDRGRFRVLAGLLVRSEKTFCRIIEREATTGRIVTVNPNAFGETLTTYTERHIDDAISAGFFALPREINKAVDFIGPTRFEAQGELAAVAEWMFGMDLATLRK